MKKILIAFAFTTLAVSFAKATDSAKTAPAANSKVAQTHNFEDLLVQGKYHFSDEAVTTVEDDKVLDSLIGVRAEFKDRIKQSSGLY